MAMVEVELRSGPFSDQGFITGKVFVQCDCADPSLQESEELGIPGVRVLLQNGISTVTDSEGKYNFIGLSPRLYVVRVDESTLPTGATLVPGSNRHADDGASVFVDLTKGEMHRADFSTGSATAATVQDVKARRQRGEITAAIRDTAALGPMAAPRAGERLRLSDTPYTSVRPEATLGDGNTRLPVPPGENAMRWPAPNAEHRHIRVTVPENSIPADGETTIPVRIDVGPPASASADSIQVTLEATDGRWLVEDANDSLPGVQTTVQRGDVVLLEAPASPGDITVRVSAGRPPVVERNLRRVARLGDGWMTTAWPAADFAESRRRICAYAPDYGRSFDDLPCALYYNININDDREAAIQESQRYLDAYYTPMKFSRERVEGWVACGTPTQCIQQLQTFVDAGATDILLRFPSWDQQGQFKRCVEEVLPHFF